MPEVLYAPPTVEQTTHNQLFVLKPWLPALEQSGATTHDEVNLLLADPAAYAERIANLYDIVRLIEINRATEVD